jgi:hypothetical protein
MADGDVDEGYRRLIRPGEERTLLFKLEHRIFEMPVESAKRLIFCVARLGPLLPDPPEEFLRLFVTAGFLIRKVVGRLPGPDRKQFGRLILERVEPIGFGAVFLSSMQPQTHEPETARLFSVGDETELTEIFADRISLYAASGSLLAGRADEAAQLLRIWQKCKGGDPVQAHVGALLETNPHAAEKLLIAFASLFRGGVTALTQEIYDYAIKFVKPEDLLRACKSIGLPDPARPDAIARWALQFDLIYRAATSQEAQTAET